MCPALCISSLYNVFSFIILTTLQSSQLSLAYRWKNTSSGRLRPTLKTYMWQKQGLNCLPKGHVVFPLYAQMLSWSSLGPGPGQGLSCPHLRNAKTGPEILLSNHTTREHQHWNWLLSHNTVAGQWYRHDLHFGKKDYWKIHLLIQIIVFRPNPRMRKIPLKNLFFFF